MNYVRPTTWTWDWWIECIADIPWGLLIFVVLVVLRANGHLSDEALKGLGAAAGLMGLGHGVHTGTKHLRK